MNHVLAYPIPRAQSQAVLLFWAVLVGSALVPKVSLGGYSLGLEDAVAALGLPVIGVWLWNHKYRGVWKLRAITLTWFLILMLGIILGIAHSAWLLESTAFPSEMWQYVKRFVYFALAIRLVHGQQITPEHAVRTLLIVFAAMNAIGLLQVSSPIAEPLSALYSQDDVQFEALVSADLARSRNYSVTGFSTSWGGLASFMFAVTIAVIAFGRSRFRITVLTLAVACLLNVLFSGSRAALLSVAAVLPLFLLAIAIGPLKLQRRAALITGFCIVGLLCTYAAIGLLADRIEFLAYRNEALVESYIDGSNRFGDVRTALSALTNPYWWIFGVSNAVQRAHYVEWGVEVEPVYLLVNYGLLGLFLRYYVLWLVVRRAFTLFRDQTYSPTAHALGAAGLLGVPAYLVFSLGYFFFQESVVGTLPWLLFGVIIAFPRHPRILLVHNPALLQIGKQRGDNVR